MSQYFQEPVRHLLQELIEQSESDHMLDMLDTANRSFTEGINQFLETSGKNMQPEDIKSYLRIYPLAQALISITKFYEVNHDTDILQNTIAELLHRLEGQYSESTLH